MLFDTANSLDRQTQTSLVIRLDDLDTQGLTDLEHVIDIGDTVVCDLGDVQQTIATWQNLNDRTKIEQTQNAAVVLLTDFDVSGQFGNATLGFVRTVQIGTGNHDRAIIGDIDLATGFLGQRTNRRAPLPITSRIFSGLIFMLSMRGAKAESSPREF